MTELSSFSPKQHLISPLATPMRRQQSTARISCWKMLRASASCMKEGMISASDRISPVLPQAVRDVSVGHAHAVTVVQRQNQLLKDGPRLCLLQECTTLSLI